MNPWAHGFCAGTSVTALLGLMLLLCAAAIRQSGTISQEEERE